jgi:hypothetical protein
MEEWDLLKLSQEKGEEEIKENDGGRESNYNTLQELLKMWKGTPVQQWFKNYIFFSFALQSREKEMSFFVPWGVSLTGKTAAVLMAGWWGEREKPNLVDLEFRADLGIVRWWVVPTVVCQWGRRVTQCRKVDVTDLAWHQEIPGSWELSSEQGQ